MLGYTLKKYIYNKFEISQGIYYLIKDRQVIDSLKSPIGVNYNNNWSKYNFHLDNDTAKLGTWSYHRDRNYGNPYQQPILKKINKKWIFEIEDKVLNRPLTKVKKNIDTIEYHNFHLINKRELVFKNGSGSLKLKYDITKNQYNYNGGYQILENGEQIYLINIKSNEEGGYMSFDQGTSWYVFPLRLKSIYNSQLFLDIDKEFVISFFNNGFKNGKYEMTKVFHQFILK